MRIFIKDMQKGQEIKQVFALKSKEIKIGKSGNEYLEVNLMDRTGIILGRVFQLPSSFNIDSLGDTFVYVDGMVDDFQGKLQLKIDLIRPTVDIDVFDKSEVLLIAKENPLDCWNEMYTTVQGFKNPELKLLISTILERNKEKLMWFPAAITNHDVELGALALHQTLTGRVAKILCTLIECNTDLAVGMAYIHDIAKIVSYETNSLGYAIGMTRKAQLCGDHVVLGAFYIEALCKELGISGELKELAEHIMLSHHGKPEWGSPEKPKCKEAYVVHTSDMIASKNYVYDHIMETLSPGEFSGRIRNLDDAPVFKPENNYNS